jgi:hypothetical protein
VELIRPEELTPRQGVSLPMKIPRYGLRIPVASSLGDGGYEHK